MGPIHGLAQDGQLITDGKQTRKVGQDSLSSDKETAEGGGQGVPEMWLPPFLPWLPIQPRALSSTAGGNSHF